MAYFEDTAKIAPVIGNRHIGGGGGEEGEIFHQQSVKRVLQRLDCLVSSAGIHSYVKINHSVLLT